MNHCEICGEELPARERGHKGRERKYCSPKCRRIAWDRRHPRK